MSNQIENTQVLVIKSTEDRNRVVQFMLENNISFQSGFQSREELGCIAESLSWDDSYESEWMNSGC